MSWLLRLVGAQSRLSGGYCGGIREPSAGHRGITEGVVCDEGRRDLPATLRCCRSGRPQPCWGDSGGTLQDLAFVEAYLRLARVDLLFVAVPFGHRPIIEDEIGIDREPGRLQAPVTRISPSDAITSSALPAAFNGPAWRSSVAVMADWPEFGPPAHEIRQRAYPINTSASVVTTYPKPIPAAEQAPKAMAGGRPRLPLTSDVRHRPSTPPAMHPPRRFRICSLLAHDYRPRRHEKHSGSAPRPRERYLKLAGVLLQYGGRYRSTSIPCRFRRG
jgi:hypothetical protein